jgi:hypothetical protein
MAHRAFGVDRVEEAVAREFGVEFESDEPVFQPRFDLSRFATCFALEHAMPAAPEIRPV